MSAPTGKATFPTPLDQQGGGAGSTSLGSIALSPSGQVNFVKSETVRWAKVITEASLAGTQ
jgi:hypothetical protein